MPANFVKETDMLVGLKPGEPEKDQRSSLP